MGLFSWIFGKKPRQQQLNLLSNEQQQAQNQAAQLAVNQLQNQQQFDFGPIEQQAYSNYYNQVIPSIAERFTAWGGANKLGSSNFRAALESSGQGLATGLGALRSQYNLQQQNSLNNTLSTALRPTRENIYNPGTPGLIGSALGEVGQGIGRLGTSFVSNQIGNIFR